MSSSAPPAKRRKATLSVSDAMSPVLLSSNALALPSTLNSWKKFENERSDASLIVGETSKAYWQSFNHLEDSAPSDAGYTCQYMLAVYDKQTNEATLFPAPMHVVNPLLKSHYKRKPTVDQSAEHYAIQRSNLGLAFGNKKQQRSIKTADRNKVDITSNDMQQYQNALSATLAGVASQALPDDSSVSEAARAMPPCHREAATPTEVYLLGDLISDTEMAAIPISQFEKASSHSERIKLLPYRQVAFVNNKISEIFLRHPNKLNKAARSELRLILFFDYLFALAQGKSYKAVQERLRKTQVPDLIIDSLMDRFSEGARGASDPSLTSFTNTKARSYCLALALHISDFSIELSELSKDFGVTAKELRDWFASLGCTIVYPRNEDSVMAVDGEEEEEGQSPRKKARGKLSEARAVLKLPLVFPEPRRKRKRN